MKLFDISTDSTCDLYANEYEELDIFHCCLNYTLTDKNETNEFLDDF